MSVIEVCIKDKGQRSANCIDPFISLDLPTVRREAGKDPTIASSLWGDRSPVSRDWRSGRLRWIFEKMPPLAFIGFIANPLSTGVLGNRYFERMGDISAF